MAAKAGSGRDCRRSTAALDGTLDEGFIVARETEGEGAEALIEFNVWKASAPK